MGTLARGRAFDSIEHILKVGSTGSHLAHLHSYQVSEPDGYILAVTAEHAHQLRLHAKKEISHAELRKFPAKQPKLETAINSSSRFSRLFGTTQRVGQLLELPNALGWKLAG